MIDRITQVGISSHNLILQLGRAFIFALQVIKAIPKIRLRELMNQIHFVGVLSLVIISISALFIGMVISLQGYNILNKFGAIAELGQLVALSVFRELGPVVTALLYAGRAGSSMTAEIGLMQVSEQIDSMEMMAVDPYARILAPRFLASIISVPLLTIIFNAIAIYGGYIVGVDWLGIDAGTYLSNTRNAVDWQLDVLSGLHKSIVFGLLISWIATYQGYFTKRSAEGLGRSATKTVIVSSIVILAMDFVMTSLMIGDW